MGVEPIKFFRPDHPPEIFSTEITVQLNHNESIVHGHDEDDDEHSWSEKAWPILAVLAPLCFMGFLSNAVVVWVFVKWRVLRDRINLFVVNLAVSNLAICIVAPPLVALPIILAHTADTEEEEIVTDLVYRVSACLFGLSCYANSFATTAIALHRRRMILKSRAQMQHERPQIAVCLVMWTVSIILAIPELFRCATSDENHKDGTADLTLPTLLGPYQRLALEITRATLQFFSVSALMIFSYVSVFVALRKRSIIRSQFQRDKSLKAHAQRLSSIQFRKTPSTNHLIKKSKIDNNEETKNKAANSRTSRRPTLTGSCVTAAAASAAATVTTVVATGSMVNGRLQSTSCDTVEYVLTSGPGPNGETSANNNNNNNNGNSNGNSNRRISGTGSGLRSKVPSKMKHVWNSIRQKKFSASDSKNVCILIATIAVHFACWSPYNAVRLYVAFMEAIKNAEEPRAPIAEGIVLCIAVSSVLHCPLFYTWFNRRNRHGLVACCAAVIPCRDSLLRRRLKEIAHQGNSHRYHLPIPIDTPPARTPRRASRLQNALLRRHSRSGITDELRQILYNAQHRRSTSSQGPPPARHNSYMSDGGGTAYGGNSATTSDNEFDNTVFPDGSTGAPVPTMASSTTVHPTLSLLVNLNNDNEVPESFVESVLPNDSKLANNNEDLDDNDNHEKGTHSPVDHMLSKELFEQAITDLARKVSSPLSRSNSTRSYKRPSVVKEEPNMSKKELFQILLVEPSEAESEATRQLTEQLIVRTAENLHELKLRRALSSRSNRGNRVRFDTTSASDSPQSPGKIRRHGTTIRKQTQSSPAAGQFLTVPQKYGGPPAVTVTES